MMIKKIAYTLAEVLICVVVVGVLFTMTAANFKTDTFNERARRANLFKVVAAVQEASAKIRDIEATDCPSGAFIERINGSGTDVNDYIVSIKNADTSAKVATMYEKWIKLETRDVNYCDLFPTKPAVCTSRTIIGGRMAGGAFVGFNYKGIYNCPSYYNLQDNVTVTGRGKCWAELIIDTNGTLQPNTIGEDIFVYGIDAYGVAQ